VYWPYWKWPSQPSLYDVFLDEDHLVAILSFQFSYVRNGYKSDQMMAVARNHSLASWVLIRSDGNSMDSTFTKNDPELHSKVLIFPYDRSFGPVVTIRSINPQLFTRMCDSVNFRRPLNGLARSAPKILSLGRSEFWIGLGGIARMALIMRCFI
jgi:hypothetical protein